MTMHQNKAHKAAGDSHKGHGEPMKHAMYRRLLMMVLLSFIAMYGLMYAMVDTFGNVYGNINQAYMAALMASPMLVIELALMWKMYPDHHANLGLIAGALVVLVLSWIGIRSQVLVSDQQFIRSMIPHHAGAVLMCEKNSLKDPALRELCAQIIRSQNEEIERMKALLK